MKLDLEFWQHMVILISVAIATGTEKEFLQAFSQFITAEILKPERVNVPPVTAPEPNPAMGPCTRDPLQGQEQSGPVELSIDAIMRDLKNAGIPQTRNMYTVPPDTIQEPKPDIIEVNGARLLFIGSGPFPHRVALEMPEWFTGESEEVQRTILTRLQTTQAMLTRALTVYKQTGAFPDGTIPPGQTFKEYAVFLIRGALQK
jgi:hypothetical protein